MISLEKLNKLPRHQRLRKIEKILTQYEYQLIGKPLSSECLSKAYLLGVIQLLGQDIEFEKSTRAYLLQQIQEFQQPEDERGPVNRLRHLLLSQFGKTAADWDFIDEGGNLCRTSHQYLPGVQVFLEDIRSPFNVGSIFRTAECFGVEKLYLSPFCADPLHPRAARSAMGCVNIVPWERSSLDTLADPVFALETGGTPLDHFIFPERAIMIVGSEELGVSPEALRRADLSLGRVSIPTMGAKGSLNVSVAFGIAMQNWMRFLCLKNKTFFI
jgi:TrmH family RNA methyltransferase